MHGTSLRLGKTRTSRARLRCLISIVNQRRSRRNTPLRARIDSRVMLICQLIYSQRIAMACKQRLKAICKLIFYRSGQDHAQLTKWPAGLGCPGVKAGLHSGAVFAVLGWG